MSALPDIQSPSDIVLRAAPRWAWDILDETLALDAESGAFSADLRADIARALDAVKTVIGPMDGVAPRPPTRTSLPDVSERALEPPDRERGAPPGVTPAMAQYLDWRDRVKQQHGTMTVLAWRMGDFYEFFFADAVRVADALGLTVRKASHAGEPMAIAGIPAHRAEDCFGDLVGQGFHIALGEPVPGETCPRTGRSQMRIARLYTPGVEGET